MAAQEIEKSQENASETGLGHLVFAFDWQSTKTTLAERFGFIHNTEQFADVQFIVGRLEKNQQKIPAHKLVLSVGSAVFAAMFSDNWASANEIYIPDVEPEAFLSVLQFLYSDTVEVTADSVMAVLYAAKKYAIHAVENVCLKFLTENLNTSNAFTILNQAKLFDASPNLIEDCMKIIDNDTMATLSDDGLLDTDLSTLKSILKRDTLSIAEYDLFQAILRWSEAECIRQELPINCENQRAVLKDALDLIRFPLMSLFEFSRVVKTNLLQDKDVLSMFMHFSDRNNETAGNFSKQPRSPPYFIVNRFSEVSTDVFECNGEHKSFYIKVQPGAQFVGIGLYYSLDRTTGYTVKLSVCCIDCTISECSTVSKLWEASDSRQICEATKTFRLFLDKPLKLEDNYWYFFRISIKGPVSFCGVNGLKLISVECGDGVDSRFLFSQQPNRPGYTSIQKSEMFSKGQLPEILFTP